MASRSPRWRRFVSILATAFVVLALPGAPAGASTEDGSVVIEENSAFDQEHGVRSGKGTKSNPYVIEGWDLHELSIHDTNRYVVIRNNIISRLTLNWVGDRVKVVHNRIGDLRVNENVERTGMPTSGDISFNRFGSVGQLRHWDGDFTNNVVGAPAQDDEFRIDSPGGFRIANLDGFNGATYVKNTFYGYVELRIHGHHHSSGFNDDSHYHGAEHGKMPLTHMNRYHSAKFAQNRIYATGPYGFIYTDSNHAGNDRTATSETNEALNDPHVHYTKVAILRNELIGSGIMVDIFNATDTQKHLRTATGHMTIKGNSIKLHEYRETADGWSTPPTGIEVHEARDLHLTITNNKIAGPAVETTRTTTDSLGGHVASGIELLNLEKASVHITNNFVTNRVAGVYARHFNRVQWWINGLRTEGVENQIDYDNSGAKPQGQP
ncbi:MAG TPA: hypothetical protein VE174_01705 [Actinomycetota bacterium]|nr:hypothetical protein [Actinomycetota bacterium]